MVPLPRYSTVGGIPLPELMKPDRIEALVQRTRNGGAEVVALLKAGSAFYAPASSVLHMVDSILNDRKRVLPCAVLLRGEYKIDGLVMGVPIILGAAGVERIIEVSLTDSELNALHASAGAVQSLVDTLEATKG